MSPTWNVYGQAVEDMRDEEALNNCFADLVEDTLIRTPEFLNFVLDGVVAFDEGAELVATDLDPLAHRETGKDRKIDFTVGDSSKLVGFESKRRDSLSSAQIEGELDKLEFNADGRDVVLVAVTEDLREPSIISSYSDQVRWTSWFTISQRAFSADALSDEWNPTVSRAQKMFQEFGYTEFDSIDSEEFRVSVWNLWKQTATQMDGFDTGERWPYKTIKRAQGTSRGWKPIDPDWMLLTFRDGTSGEHSDTCFAILSNKDAEEIWVGLSTRPYKNEDLQRVFVNNAEALADAVKEHEFEVIQFPLNWLVGRKTLPEGHPKAVSAKRPSTREELVEAFSDEKRMKDDGANRFIFAYRVDESKPLEDSVDHLTRLQDIIGTENAPSLSALLPVEAGE